MVEYAIANAIDWLSDFKKEHGASDYAIIKADDGKQYQVKFSSSNSREFIAHYIASLIGVPVPPAKIIHISDYLFEDIAESFSALSALPSKHYFAVEWYPNTLKWESYEEFFGELKSVDNFNAFLSIFSYDQYLRNYDRHEYNHIIVREHTKRKFYNSIDADRIFAGYDINNILLEINEYNCHYPPRHGTALYDLIEDEHFTSILRYASAIGLIKAEEVADIISICDQLYGFSPDEKFKISRFLSERKENIYDACMRNTKCYTKVRRSLYAD